MKTTLCWSCNTPYDITVSACPNCCAVNANVNAPRDRSAYEGAREDLLDWKRRALEAEACLRTAQMRLGEPVLPEPVTQPAKHSDLRQPTHFVVAKQHPTLPEVSIFPTNSTAVADEYEANGWTVLPLTAVALEYVLEQQTQTDVEGMAEARAIAIYEAVHHDADKRIPWAHLPSSEWEGWRRAANIVQPKSEPDESDFIGAASIQETADTDALLTHLGLDPKSYRTDGGWLNLPKIKVELAKGRGK